MTSALPPDDPRIVLDRLIAERGEDYARLSRALNRNPAYIQQYIKRGSPRRLAEDDRAKIARFLGVDESVLGGRQSAIAPALVDRLVPVPLLDIGASAGAGALDTAEGGEAMMAFDPRWLRRLSATPKALSIIRVAGNSMVPTLNDGDDIMVDQGDGVSRLRDGIYVLRRDDTLLVKRLARGAARDTVSIISDNAAYPSDPHVAIADLSIVGRVVWAGRRLG